APTGDFNTFLIKLEIVLNIITKLNHRIIFCGDFNVPFHKPNSQVKDLINLFACYGLTKSVTQFTRITLKSEMCIDNIFTNLDGEEYNVHSAPGLSDHNILIFRDITLAQTNIKTKIVTKTNRKYFTYLLQKNDWSYTYKVQNIEDVFNEFLEDIIDCKVAATHTYKINKKSSSNTNWFTEDLKNERDKIADLIELNKDSKTSERSEEIVKRKKLYRKNIRESKLKANDQLLFESNNPSKTAWKLINRAWNSEEVENSTITPDQFNNYFVNTAAEIHSKVLTLGNTHPSSSSIQYQQESIFLTPTHLSEVKSTINNLKNTKSMDIYGLNPELIKTALPVIAEP
ncbi:hypothetical protein CBL_21017, partial [Carabus blaptoides fortunei]